MTNYLTIGERVKSARMLAPSPATGVPPMTQKELAEAIGTKQANISHIESGRSKPTAQVTDRIFEVLRNASAKSAELLDTYDGVLGIQGRSHGKLTVVLDPMAPPIPKEWVVQDFLAKRNVTVLAGQEGGGKSMLSQTVTAACITGATEVFGFHMPGKPMRVLIVDVENVLANAGDVDPSIVTERLQAYGMTEDNKHLVTITGPEGWDFDQDSDSIDGILTDAAKSGAPFDVVIFDSFRSLWTTGSENTPAAGRVLKKYMNMAHKHNVAILVLHHQNKAGAAYSGHSSIGSTVSALWTFSKMLQPSGAKGVPATPHPTMRFLSPYKVRIAPMAKSRIVSTSGEGIVAPLSADEYAALVVDPGTPDEGEEGTTEAE